MKIVSSFRDDIRHEKTEAGGYEWWYFDAIDKHGVYKLVVILYDGNPFSLEYINAIEKRNNAKNILASQHPGLSISIYKDDEPIFYDLCEFKVKDARFSSEKVDISLGNNKMIAIAEDEVITYILSLDEKLPSGDHLGGSVSFVVPFFSNGLKGIEENEAVRQHTWNLISSRAEVSAELYLTTKYKGKTEIIFQGSGYHDHNYGQIPLFESFTRWYWGRFHFENMNLIFYVMEHTGFQQRAWLTDRNGEKIVFSFDQFTLEDSSTNVFMLSSHRCLKISGSSDKDPKIRIDFSKVLDSGPFYKRFTAQAIMNDPAKNKLERSIGLAEYFEPGRMTWRIFWPLIKMRFRYVGKPHPVQRSARLYRWTW